MKLKKVYVFLIILCCSLNLQASKSHQLKALSHQINEFFIQDQALRNELIQKNFKDDKVKQKINELDKKSSNFILSLLSNYGWPEKSRLSAQTYHKFMTLIIHSSDKKMMQQVFVHVLHDFLHDEGSDYQYFTLYVDKVFSKTHGYQIFGTQFQTPSENKKSAPKIWNKSHIDERRKKLNLMPLSTYKKMMNHMYTKKNKHVSKNF
tara:strand:+ start:8206 stop:8823 length:618 start_codon:yes stop_codon:yes gene_type:complete